MKLHPKTRKLNHRERRKANGLLRRQTENPARDPAQASRAGRSRTGTAYDPSRNFYLWPARFAVDHAAADDRTVFSIRNIQTNFYTHNDPTAGTCQLDEQALVQALVRIATKRHDDWMEMVQAFTVAVENTAPPPPLPVEVRAGEIIGWRAWQLERGKCGNLYLRSVYQPDRWAPGVPMRGNPDDVSYSAFETIPIGVHAWSTRKSATAYARHAADGMAVIGTVELWGKVIEHEEGYRAEYAAVRSIDENEVTWGTQDDVEALPAILQQLRETYGVGASDNITYQKPLEG